LRYSERRLQLAAAAETVAWIAAPTFMLTTGNYFPFSWLAPLLFLFAYIGGFITVGWLANFQTTDSYGQVNWMMASLLFPPIVLSLLIIKTL
jgi:hypothetical protein